jgi:hypothetical protein
LNQQRLNPYHLLHLSRESQCASQLLSHTYMSANWSVLMEFCICYATISLGENLVNMLFNLNIYFPPVYTDVYCDADARRNFISDYNEILFVCVVSLVSTTLR